MLGFVLVVFLSCFLLAAVAVLIASRVFERKQLAPVPASQGRQPLSGHRHGGTLDDEFATALIVHDHGRRHRGDRPDANDGSGDHADEHLLAHPSIVAALPERNLRVKTAPPSGAFSAVTVPPCDCATCLTIDNPSPEPGRWRADAAR